jgi:ribose transport system permease protein
MNQQGYAAEVATPDQERLSFKESFRVLMGKAGPIVALLILAIFLSIKTDRFLSIQNFTNVIRQAASIGLIAIGMMLAILTGGIDLSVGALMALTTILMGKAVQAGLGGILPVLICLGSGFLLGALNGVLLTKLKLPHPFISTMGTQNIFRGACLLLTAGTPISGMPMAVKWAGSSFIANAVPVSAVILIVVYVIFGFFLRNTTLGRHIYVVGGNTTTARLSGVNVDFTLIMVYALSGLMCGLAGLILAGRVDAVYPMAGIGWDTDAIASVIIGGSSFFGGRGNILGTFIGLLLISVLRNGLNLMNITPDMQTVVLGTVIILAVFIDVVRNGGFARVKKA